ncbi:hypothetical protein [Marinobacter salicampi]|uniref:hypothetical protein n=1 Tax=Marinobacter salicampi TaxID=435907 RepID=UPI001408BB5F|nr:hypothetical protein [Marinobacter salicampi]
MNYKAVPRFLAAAAVSVSLTGCGDIDGRVVLGWEDLNDLTHLEVSGQVYAVDKEGYEKIVGFCDVKCSEGGLRNQIDLAVLDGDRSLEEHSARLGPDSYLEPSYTGGDADLYEPFRKAAMQEADAYLAAKADGKDISYFKISEETFKLAEPYAQAALRDQVSYIEQLDSVSLEGNDLVFSGITEEHEAIVVFAKVTYELSKESGTVYYAVGARLYPDIRERAEAEGELAIYPRYASDIEDGIEEDLTSPAFADEIFAAFRQTQFR